MATEQPLPADRGQSCAGPPAGPAHAADSGARAAHAIEATYPLVILGSGASALIAAQEAMSRGVRVALVLPESPLPSETDTAQGEFGRRLLHVSERLAGSPCRLPPEHERLDIYRAPARFLDRRTLEVGDKRLHFRRAIIAPVVQPALPDIPGAVESGCLRPADLDRLAGPPARVAVVGAGPVACLWAQTFGRLGSRVNLVVPATSTLPGEEPEAAALLVARLEAEDVRVRLQSAAQKIERTGNLRAVVIQSSAGKEKLLVNEVLVCGEGPAGLESLGLEAAGVAFDSGAILVDQRMRTSCRGIFAAGPLCRGPFGPLGPGNESACLAAANALAWIARRLDPLAPACWVLTEPEVVRLGLSRGRASALGMRVQTLRAEISAGAGASLVSSGCGSAAEQPQGLVLMHLDVRSRRVVGATAVCEGAAELLAAVRAALGPKRRLEGLLGLAAPSGSRLDVLRRLAEKWVHSQRHRRRFHARTYLRVAARRLIGLR